MLALNESLGYQKLLSQALEVYKAGIFATCEAALAAFPQLATTTEVEASKQFRFDHDALSYNTDLRRERWPLLIDT